MAESNLPPDTPQRSLRDEFKPEQERTSPWMVVFAGALSALTLGACCLCGGAVWWFRPEVTQNPVRAEQLLAEIVAIQIPESYQPVGTIEWNIAFAMSVRGVYYERFVGDGLLTIIEVGSQFRGDADVRRHIRQTLIEKGAGGTPLVINDKETTRQEFTVRDQVVPFTFEIGRDPPTGRTYHLVQGIFDGRSGEVLFGLRVNEDHWDKAEIITMLESLASNVED